MQRNTSHALVLTAGGQTVLIDAEVSALVLMDYTGKEGGICIQKRKGTPDREVTAHKSGSILSIHVENYY